jgi:hypothetical protein
MHGGVAMSNSKKGGRRKKPLIAWNSSTCSGASTPTIIIIALTTLLTSGGFVLIITPTLMTTALAQEVITATTGAATITTDTITDATSPPPGIEFSPQPDLNFSEFPEFDDFSQSQDLAFPFPSSIMTDINGTYVNPNIGFRIDLPVGWKGVEINFLINSVFAVPGETNLELLTQQGAGGGEAFQEPATFMTIVGIDQESFNMLESIVPQLPALRQGGGGGGQGGAGGQEEVLPQGSSDPLGTATTPFGDNAVSCTYLQPSFVTINGINAEERVGECIDEEAGVGVGTNPKTKSYTFATQDNSLIIVGFFGNSTITYDQNLPLFEESVRTISISRPADIATSDIYNRYKELVEMQQQQQLLLSNQTSGGGGM